LTDRDSVLKKNEPHPPEWRTRLRSAQFGPESAWPSARRPEGYSFLSSGLGAVAGGAAGFSPPGFAGATAPGAAAGVVGGASSVQPTNAIASARLESIDKAWIADFTFTGALLESCVTRQTISIFKSQMTRASGPHVAKTIRETTLPHAVRVRIIVDRSCPPQRIVGFWNPIRSVSRH
jgi:hypothetical protein